MTQSAPYQQQSYQQHAYRELRRSRDDRMVAGICAGFGRYLNIDPVAARVLFVILAVFSGGTALIAYFFAWLVMPEEPATWQQPQPAPANQTDATPAA
jgi:phage shock protein PspC (stress-responsive transcriptional regulator)